MTKAEIAEQQRQEATMLRERSVMMAIDRVDRGALSTLDIIKSADKIYQYITVGTIPAA